MRQNKDNFFEPYRKITRRTLLLAGTLLFLIFLASCGGEKTRVDTGEANTGIQQRPEIVEGLKLTHEKKYEEATAKVYELINKDPKDAEALAVMSYILLKSGRIDNAREMAKRAMAIDTQLFRPYMVLARVHFQQSGFNEALDLARQALVINPESFEAYRIIGEIYLRRGLTQDAITVFKEAVRLSPENPELLNLMSSSYIKSKQYDHALSTLLALQEIDSNYPGAHFNLAVVYANMKDGHKAMKHIAKAEKLYAQEDNILWMGKTRDIRRVIARDFKLRPEDIDQ